MQRSIVPVFILGALLCGCSSGGGLSTASVLGNDAAPTPQAGAASPPATTAAAVPAAPSDPTARAFFVGSVSARAEKCGYNFDPVKVKTSFMDREAGLGTAPDQMAKIEKAFQIAHNGVAKAAADEPNYCNDKKTREIKDDLTRVLAGDYEPPRAKVVAQKDSGGIFGGFFDSDSVEAGPSFGSDDWWSKQNSAVGN